MQILSARKSIDCDRSEVQNGSKVYEHIQEQPEYSHDERNRFIVPCFKELRHGIDVVLQVNRDEPNRNNDERYGGDPLVSCNSNTEEETFAAHSNKLFSRNI